MKLLYLLSFIVTGFVLCGGPDVTTQNILYHSPSRTDKGSGVITRDLNRILIKGKTKLEWQDGHSAVKYAFEIKSVNGSLSLDKSGEITYQVTSEKASGRFIVKKTGAVIKITAMLAAEGKPLTVDFEITSYTLLD